MRTYIGNKLLLWRSSSITFAYDLCTVIASWLMAYWLRFDLRAIPQPFLHQALIVLPEIVVMQVILFRLYGLYRGVWRFASIPDLTRIVKASVMGMIIILVASFFMRAFVELPRAVPILYMVLLIGSLGSARALFRWLKDYRRIFYDSQRVLIVGAGNAGEGLIRDLIRHAKHLYQPVAIVDDNPRTWCREIHGVSVVGNCSEIVRYAVQFEVHLIMIAMPSANSVQMRRIVELCEQAHVPYRTLPSLRDLAEGKVNVKNLREVALEDLLGRDPVDLDWKSLNMEFQAKTILVCGGGGSIGSELCRQLAFLSPAHLLIVDHHEYNLYAIDMELRKSFPSLHLTCLLQDVKDETGIKRIFETYCPQMVFHAAAYKHVPLLESQCRVGIMNNIVGTRTLAEAAVKFEVKKFVFISTDKAVNPTNMMGATKRAAEIFCQNFNELTQTEFITVRFGNVLDSAGSVVPLFRKQLQSGGPLTVTHPEITRFFMTIPEASQLIMQAAFMGKGGEIFVLDMGEPVKISYLAEQLIRLAGKVPGEDIEIVYTGLRPGEKLYEELFHEQENLRETTHPKIMLAEARKVFWVEWLTRLNTLQQICQREHNEDVLLEMLGRLVPDYAVTNAFKVEKLNDSSIIPLQAKEQLM